MLFWIFLMRCSSRSTVIFLIVTKETQKYDQRKSYFFLEKKHFQIWYSHSSLKRNWKKNCKFFFRTPKLQNKKFAISKISNKKFRKIHYFANIKYKRKIFVKRKIFAKKNLIKNIFTKTKFVEKNFRKKNFSEKKIRKKCYK